jgi:hypothetical protein
MPSKKAATKVPPKLTKTEEDLLWHLNHGYQLESSSVGGELLLRRLKDNSVKRTASANRSTIRALEQRGLVSASGDALTTIWQANKAAK